MTRALRFLVCCLFALALPLQGWAAHVDCGKAQMLMQAQLQMQTRPASSMHDDCADHHKSVKMADKCGSGACCCHAVAMNGTELLIDPQPGVPAVVPTVPLAHTSVPLAGIEKPPRAALA